MLVVVVDDGFPCCLCLPAGLPAIQPVVVGGSAELSAGMAGKPACGSSSSEREGRGRLSGGGNGGGGGVGANYSIVCHLGLTTCWAGLTPWRTGCQRSR